MRQRLYLIAALVVFSMSVGCATGQKAMYNWRNYSGTLYAYKKSPNDETLKAHKESLVQIMETAKEEGYRVPPGVYCEYGYYMALEGKTQDAAGYFEMEIQSYPESKVFVERLKAQLSKPESKPEEKPAAKAEAKVTTVADAKPEDIGKERP